MSNTTGGLPLMAQTQNQRYLTYNELAWAVTVLQSGVISRSEFTPPGSPSVGDAYIVADTATGAWAAHENDIAFYFGSVWNFLSPEVAQGNGVYVQDEDLRVRWDALGSPAGYVDLLDIDATDVAYAPAVPEDWGSPLPDDTAQALDELAARASGGTTLSQHEFTVSGDGPYTLSASSSGDFEALYLDGIRMPSANFTVVGDQLTLVGLTSALYERGVLDFSTV